MVLYLLVLVNKTFEHLDSRVAKYLNELRQYSF